MLRHYYITDSLEDLAQVERALINQDIMESQIHVLSELDAEVAKLQLHEVESVLRKDVVHSTEVGAIIGIILALVTLIFAYSMNWFSSSAGWLPFVFLSIIILGFCTWEGGLIGIQTDNINFRRFKRLVNNGKHLLFVDIEPRQKYILDSVMKNYPSLQTQGTGDASPSWVVYGREKYQTFMKSMT
jgi:hypothetical protein